MLDGATVHIPPETGTFLTAQKVKEAQRKQPQLDI
jgi:hypothetical protein